VSLRIFVVIARQFVLATYRRGTGGSSGGRTCSRGGGRRFSHGCGGGSRGGGRSCSFPLFGGGRFSGSLFWRSLNFCLAFSGVPRA